MALKPQRITLADGKTIDLKLPQGLEDGTKIRLAGKGKDGPGGRGDAIVTIEIAPHRFYTRDGTNIRLELPVTLKEAVLGAKVKVPTPEGPVMLTIPKGTTSARCCGSRAAALPPRTASAATSWSPSRSTCLPTMPSCRNSSRAGPRPAIRGRASASSAAAA